MEDLENIVSRLISQHRILQKDLSDIANLSVNNNLDYFEIDRILKQFNKDLISHLELENNIFYAELIKRMEKANQDTVKTKQFIDEMEEIGKTVIGFLDKYKNSEIIKNKIIEFKSELNSIINVLNLRIESEEAGIYTYWGMF